MKSTTKKKKKKKFKFKKVNIKEMRHIRHNVGASLLDQFPKRVVNTFVSSTVIWGNQLSNIYVVRSGTLG